MPNIVIYTSTRCPYCIFTKELLAKKQVAFEEINIETNPHKRLEMEQLSNRRTIPQIFINGKHIGGFDDLSKLDKEGLLDPLLK